MGENPGSCRVVYANMRGLHKNLSNLSLNASGANVTLCFEALVSSKRHISELMISGFQGWLIGFEGWQYTCMIAFRHIDSTGSTL